MSRGRGLHQTTYDRLTRLENLAKFRFNPNGNIWDHVADFPPEVFLHRNPIDLGKPLAYAQVTQILVEGTKADWHVAECVAQIIHFHFGFMQAALDLQQRRDIADYGNEALLLIRWTDANFNGKFVTVAAPGEQFPPESHGANGGIDGEFRAQLGIPLAVSLGDECLDLDTDELV